MCEQLFDERTEPGKLDGVEGSRGEVEDERRAVQEQSDIRGQERRQ